MKAVSKPSPRCGSEGRFLIACELAGLGRWGKAFILITEDGNDGMGTRVSLVESSWVLMQEYMDDA